MDRILALSVITFLEGIRNRSVYGIVLFSLFVLGLNIAVAGFFMRDIGKVTVDMNLSALSFAGLLLVFFIGLNLISKDIDRKTIQLVLSKPISRVEYIWGKFLGIQLFVLVSVALLLLLSCATIGLIMHLYPTYFGDFSWGIFFLSCGFIFLKLSVLTAVVVFFSAITTSSFVTLVFSICCYIVGETIEEVIFFLKSGAAAAEVAMSETLLRVVDIVSYILPNLAVFDFKIEAAHGLTIDGGRIFFSLGYGVAYILLLLFLASAIFRRREFH